MRIAECEIRKFAIHLVSVVTAQRIRRRIRYFVQMQRRLGFRIFDFKFRNVAILFRSAIRNSQSVSLCALLWRAVPECVAAKQNRQLREMVRQAIANTRLREAKDDRHSKCLGRSRDPLLGEY
jgi:hypothetical protein